MKQQKSSSNNGQGASSRAAAAAALFQVLEKGESLSVALPHATNKLSDADKRLASAISYGVLRVLPSLNRLVGAKLDKPLKGQLKVLHYLLLVGAYQLYCLRIKDHAAVSATVEAARTLRKRNHKALVNGILRQLLREAPSTDESQQRELPDDPMQNHPRWLFDTIQADHPEHAKNILSENNAHPPMWLRINRRYANRDEYLKQLQNNDLAAEADLQASDAIRLHSPCPVEKLPGFAEGYVSVQDRSAQLAADLLNVNASHRVLDCCAAPGGKLLHLLERDSFEQPVQAIDIDARRLDRVHENLKRAGLSALIHCADVAATNDWWNGEQFDRILLDAPCSATGVIRRHPDIKWLRRAEDVSELASLQRQILDSLWSLLKPGGELLYATCSILRQENQTQIESFLKQQSSASLISISAEQNTLQLLPGNYNGDGFFYARLKKVE
ncbi:16S rRNA (cytosine(967)-C(5))-methyltransferase RsmB [Idiomarina aminovorans]|uniref:16S rRNA (cytosine(967)-C(5))-methyltransferase RsmB n=1 Tax=Idiomarina aminovorans TaxID=2914829 RepID=UPI002005D2C7|nr:16S rRNA (cytosine(967)-C(5))-methyltransferase RsmB [Idiomarina sp. ATCH4]MCK7460262.1 16S rRNA (cytosine(967)-C(5))-methyltransferase RsmB [Idiomarina sp. ATCH4]